MPWACFSRIQVKKRPTLTTLFSSGVPLPLPPDENMDEARVGARGGRGHGRPGRGEELRTRRGGGFSFLEDFNLRSCTVEQERERDKRVLGSKTRNSGNPSSIARRSGKWWLAPRVSLLRCRYEFRVAPCTKLRLPAVGGVAASDSRLCRARRE